MGASASMEYEGHVNKSSEPPKNIILLGKSISFIYKPTSIRGM
jgi:hypothetical protein